MTEKYQQLTTEEFRDLLILKLLQVPNMAAAKKLEYQLTAADQDQINLLQQKYYNNWDWVYGQSPEYTVKKRKHFRNGTIDARILIDQGKIKQIKFYGDFFGTKDVAELEKQLQQMTFRAEAIDLALQNMDLDLYFKGIERKEIIRLSVE